MKLVSQGRIWVALSRFEEKDIAKEAGFKWNPESRVWWTSSPEVALKLVSFADTETEQSIDDVLNAKKESVVASHAGNIDADFPHPEGLDYLPFQKAGIAYAVKRPNTLFADEMGLGKTIEAIGVINSTSPKRVLVICPASLKLNWQRELIKWLTLPLSVEIANGVFPSTDVVILNFEAVKKHQEAIKQVSWDLLIVDEAHYLKSYTAQRTKLILGYEEKGNDFRYHTIKGIAHNAKRKLFLTGTPILNRPVELWPTVHCLDPVTFPNFMTFAKRYCGAEQSKYGWNFSGASNLESLQETLRGSIMIRREKKDVLKELPPKVRQVIELKIDELSHLIVEEKSKESYWKEEIRKTEQEREESKDNETAYKDAVEKLKELNLAQFTEMALLRHKTALAKAPYVVDFVKEVLESQNQVVVFAHHHDVIEVLRSGLEEFGVNVLTGENTLEERQAAVDSFQSGKSRVFVGGIQASGLGITLTAASTVVFAELDWVPGNLTQAEDRCHRLGQRDSVLVYHVVADGSLDARMAKVIVEKQDVADRALNKET